VAIGLWGLGVIFTVSDRKEFTFADMNHTVNANWANHSRIGMKDQTEYLRPGLQKLTFTMTFDANRGVKPRKMLDKLERFTERGDAYIFVVGGKRVGRHKWRITDLSEAWEVVYNRGELARAKVNVTMQEYV